MVVAVFVQVFRSCLVRGLFAGHVDGRDGELGGKRSVHDDGSFFINRRKAVYGGGALDAAQVHCTLSVQRLCVALPGPGRRARYSGKRRSRSCMFP